MDSNKVIYFVKNENNPKSQNFEVFVQQRDYAKAKVIIDPFVNRNESHPDDGSSDDLKKLMILSVGSILISPVIFTIPYYFRISNIHHKEKVISGIISLACLSLGIIIVSADIYLTETVRDSGIAAFVILSSIKGFLLNQREKYLLSYLFQLPLLATAILLVLFKLKLI